MHQRHPSRTLTIKVHIFSCLHDIPKCIYETQTYFQTHGFTHKPIDFLTKYTTPYPDTLVRNQEVFSFFSSLLYTYNPPTWPVSSLFKLGLNFFFLGLLWFLPNHSLFHMSLKISNPQHTLAIFHKASKVIFLKCELDNTIGFLLSQACIHNDWHLWSTQPFFFF